MEEAGSGGAAQLGLRTSGGLARARRGTAAHAAQWVSGVRFRVSGLLASGPLDNPTRGFQPQSHRKLRDFQEIQDRRRPATPAREGKIRTQRDSRERECCQIDAILCASCFTLRLSAKRTATQATLLAERMRGAQWRDNLRARQHGFIGAEALRMKRGAELAIVCQAHCSILIAHCSRHGRAGTIPSDSLLFEFLRVFVTSW